MTLFNRAKKNSPTKLIVEFINSKLPRGIYCRETIDSDSKIVIIGGGTAHEYEFNFEEKIEELTEVDKLHLTETIIIPILRVIDGELRETHTSITERIKELESSL